jgi:hypothetical protein
MSIICSKSSLVGIALIVIARFLGSTSIHLQLETLPLFCFENSSNSSSKFLYKELSFNLLLSDITSHTFTIIDGISTFTPLTIKCA